MQKKKVVAICGSTRLESANLRLLKAIVDLSTENFSISIYRGIGDLPQFNPDLDLEIVPENVAVLRNELHEAEGIIICTPEYAHGVPGALKNAIDWTISASSFPHKPTMLITASTGGYHGHHALMATLKAIEAGNVEQLQLVIPFVNTKVNTDNQIIHHETLREIESLIAIFLNTIHEQPEPAE